MKFTIRHIRRAVHRKAVAAWHSHHKPTVGEVFALGGFVDGTIVAAGVMGIPVAQALDDGATWEVSRLAIGPDAPRFAASRMLGACGRVMDEAGITRQISYTRVDEKGTCYKAAGWRPVAYVEADTHTHGNRATWLPGVYTASTEPIARVRWERGERAATSSNVEWDETGGVNRWVKLSIERPA